MDYGHGGMMSGASVISFATTKSSLSKLSRKSVISAHDAFLTSQATAQAVQAAKAILKAGGSELTALKTAKAAAVSALIPDPTADNELSSGIGTSFLRRRRLKRRAEVVASMALASALVSLNSDWDGNTSNASLQGMKLVGGPTSSDTLGMSTKESSSLSEDLRDLESRKPTPRLTAAERISQQLMMIPSLSATFSGSCGSRRVGNLGDSGRFGGSGESRGSGRSTTGSGGSALSGASRGSYSASSGEHSFERQFSSFTNNSSKGQSTYFSDPHNMLPNRRKRGYHHDRCTFSNNNSGCLSYSYSDENSVDSERTTGAVDSVLLSILNALTTTCGSSTAPTRRPRDVPVPSRMDDIAEEEEYDEDIITFDGDDGLQFQLSHHLERIKERDGEEDEEGEEAEKVVEHRHMAKNDHKVEEDEAPFMNTSESSGGDSIGTTGEEILLDLLASVDPRRIANGSTKPPAVTASGNKFELRVPPASDSVDELSMDGLTNAGEEHDENAHYVQLVPIKRRIRRLNRGYLKVGGLTPNSQGHSFVLDAPDSSPVKSKMGFFRKKKNKWRK
jgi:hypothetical protein